MLLQHSKRLIPLKARIFKYLPFSVVVSFLQVTSYLPTYCIDETLNLSDMFKFKLKYNRHVYVVSQIISNE
jgi:hypothetical protein